MSATLLHDDPVLDEFAEVVGSSAPIAVSGGRTRWNLGGPLTAGTTTISAPTGIVDYIPEEMIVTVRAGTPVSELHGELAERGQWTALPERGGTVGGAVAVGQNHHERPVRGDVRSAVLQVRYVSAEGRLITGGGPTVKNVSGFDLPRLLTGSLGTLGCIAEVILRTNPIPAETRWFESGDVDPFAIQRTLLAPGPVLWDGTSTKVMVFGHPPTVAASIEELASIGTFEECAAPDAPTGHRWSLRPSDLRDLTAFDTGEFVAEVGIGVLHAAMPQPTTPLPPANRRIHERMKAEFDPTNRLNPGRVVGAR